MLTSDVKRRIDAARDVLVGVAPNPTTQIEQITFALIYKFMHDMDQSAVKAGGAASFFTGTLKKYSWDKVLDSRLGNHEKLALYAEALEKFTEAKQLPELFRSIFRSAYLPYKSPETLGLFLKEMNHFDYTHPEELGNAYEYLLSIMSSQGDAGQFRTPRHIIDFMVGVINPSKDDRILDPACGTGGFLISTYRHILEQHDGKYDPKKREKPLTPDERKKLMANLEGYDIDPTMVRIAQVNMYLHQFKSPQIFQYDTLTSEERWNDKYDVILANPPFMTPKGGIRPHNKFGIASNRAEVLFVDYILNHLRPNGKAGIIVPEGIIFQRGKAYKGLRKILVANGLYAVVSLPTGVFQPYSGVKTSILFIDPKLAKALDDILFVKISNDGFDLGATKRPIKDNDLPEALKLLEAWEKGDRGSSQNALYVSKEEIAKDGDYKLTSEKYREDTDFLSSPWPISLLSTLEDEGTLQLGRGQVISKTDLLATPGEYPVYSSSAQGTGEFGKYGKFMFDEELVTWSVDGGGRFFYRPGHKFSVTNVSGWLRILDKNKLNAQYLYLVLDNQWRTKEFNYVAKAHPSVIRGMYKIPIPPIKEQDRIVREIDKLRSEISEATARVQELELGVQEAISEVWNAD
jgi:type I restriction enzyme M protein